MEDVVSANAGFTLWLYMGIPRFGSSWTESGDVRLGSLAAVVADDLVDLDNDVLWDFGLYRIAVNHLGEGYALFIILSDRHLAEHLVFAGDDDADEITRYVFLPCAQFF